MKTPTLVLGASTNPARYANIAIQRLREGGHEVIAIGRDVGSVSDVNISQQWPSESVHTVTLYLSPKRQPEYYAPIIAMKPRRVIFNPGTENPKFAEMLQREGIVTENACTLVLLSTGAY